MPASLIVRRPPRRWNSAIQAGNFDALVDALRRSVELAVPVDRLGARSVRRGHGEIDGIDGRAGLVPEIEAEIALVLQARCRTCIGSTSPCPCGCPRRCDSARDGRRSRCRSRPQPSCRPAWPPPTIVILRFEVAIAFSPSSSNRSARADARQSIRSGIAGIGALGPHRGVAAIDADIGAGDEARIVGQQEGDRLRDLAGIARSAQKMERPGDAVGLGAVAVGQLDHDVAPGPARRDRVDADAVGRKVHRLVARQLQDRRLARPDRPSARSARRAPRSSRN